MSTEVIFRARLQLWRAAICLVVAAYLILGALTGTIHFYHWFILSAVPFALMSGERGRRFFLDWSPLFAFWIIYDRLRMIQPWLYDRVAVERPLVIERLTMGWLASGQAPPHAAHAWLIHHPGLAARSIEWLAQAVYFSHLFLVPLIILSLWIAGESRRPYRTLFVRSVLTFTLLNFSAIAIYLILPVAPPWWVTLNGLDPPTSQLVARANIGAAMSGALIQGMIRNASQWFAAVPSLHGAYPVLLLLLFRDRGRSGLVALALYGCAMWIATVVLNQHYVIDLVAGAVLAVAAFYVENFLSSRLVTSNHG